MIYVSQPGGTAHIQPAKAAKGIQQRKEDGICHRSVNRSFLMRDISFTYTSSYTSYTTAFCIIYLLSMTSNMQNTDLVLELVVTRIVDLLVIQESPIGAFKIHNIGLQHRQTPPAPVSSPVGHVPPRSGI